MPFPRGAIPCLLSRPRRPWLSRVGSILALAFVLGQAGTLLADPVTYTLTGSFSGSLGSELFNNQQGVFSFTGDTSNVFTPDQAFFFNTLGTASFQFTGSGLAVFDSNNGQSAVGVESEYGAASFMDTRSGFGLGEYNELTPYDVLSAFGDPVTGSAVFTGLGPEHTSLGDLVLTEASTDLTFALVAPSSVTPEPGTLMLSGSGLLVAATAFRRRIRRRA